MKKILLVLIPLLLTGCMVRVKTNEDYINEANIEINAPEYLEVNSRVTYDLTDLMLLINNKSEEDIYKLNIEATYLDNKGNTVGTFSNSYDNIAAKWKILGFTILPRNDNGISYIPDKIKVDIKVEKGKGTKTYNKDIESAYTIDNDEITIDVINKSKKALKQVNMVMLYYYEDKMVHYNEIILDDLDNKEVLQEKVNIPDDLVYDKTEVIVNSAY